jgi:hypothetical protein
MSIKIGLEKEMFLLDKDKKPVVIPEGLPFDECGLLLEARGKPSTDIYEAVYSLMAEEKRIRDLVKLKYPELIVSDSTVYSVDRKTKVSANRTYAKGVLSYRNIYGFEHHKNNLKEVTAGIHISFTNEHEMTWFTSEEIGDHYRNNEHKQTFNLNFDWLQVFLQLDTLFKKEITDAKRNMGFYEIKGDGRIEYRSLPSNVSMDKIISALNTILHPKKELCQMY